MFRNGSTKISDKTLTMVYVDYQYRFEKLLD